LSHHDMQVSTTAQKSLAVPKTLVRGMPIR
jgi:hypothetical protein